MGSKKTIVRRQSIARTQLFPKDMPALLQRIYLNRGIGSDEEANTGLAGLLPFEGFRHIHAAAALLYEGLQNQQRLLVVGDFDADGATSTALAVSALKAFGAKQVEYLIPHRLTYGYGLTPEIVAMAAQRQAEILITVDNGITSHEGVLAAKNCGMRVLITDHHLAGDHLPAADVIVNPNQPEDQFSSKAIAGVGVIFYVMLALRAKLRSMRWFENNGLIEPPMTQFLDLVALGTVADVVPLDKNNRILVQQGLRRIRAGVSRPGIQALLDISQREAQHCQAVDLGFAVAPRLNAAGRLDDMSVGVACLLSGHYAEAMVKAMQLDQLNRERQNIEAMMVQQADALLKHFSLKTVPAALCLYNPAWHQGVIGILAGRIKDRYHRPTIIFAKAEGDSVKGSARSIPALHIRDILATLSAKYPGMIEKFGGHAMAAGLTLPLSHYDLFCQRFQAMVEAKLDSSQLQNTIMTDGELSTQELTVSTAELLRVHGPWGQGFPEPLFDGCFTVIDQKTIAEKHLKLYLQSPNGTDTIEAMVFNALNETMPANHINLTVKIAYRLAVNDYKGQRKLQFVVEHLENPASDADRVCQNN